MLLSLIQATIVLILLPCTVHSRSFRSRSVRRGDNGSSYEIFPASSLPSVGPQTQGSHHSQGDYVMHGLQATIDQVSRAYDLRDSDNFYWGLDGRPVANMIAYAYGKNVRVLSMERFESVLQAADCSSDEIKLTFTQETQFDQVERGWSWINEAEDNYVVLVTETSRCNRPDGDATDRQPWHVKGATFNDTTNVVTLAAEPKTWQEAFSHWHLDFDSRGLISDHAKRGESALSPRSSADPDIDLNTHVQLSLPLSNGGSITCKDCRTSGGVDYTISLDESLTGTLEVFAYNLGAHIGLDAELPTDLAGKVSGSVPLIPGAGGAKLLKVAGLNINVGPALTFALQGDLKSSKPVDVTTGFDFKLDEPEATFQTHFDASGFSQSTGQQTWDSTFIPIPFDFSDDVDLTATIQVQIGLDYSVGASKFSLGAELEAGLILAAPILTLEGSPREEEGACGVPAATAGVALTLDAGAAFLVHESARVLALSTEATQTITSVNALSTTTCIAITPAADTKGSGPSQTGSSGSGPVPTGGGSEAPSNSSNPYPWGYSTCNVNGALVCRDERHFGLCNRGKVIWQPVAAGTGCFAGRIVGTGVYAVPASTTALVAPPPTATPGTPSCTNGLLYCSDDGTQYALCNWGQLAFQPVAKGTTCQSGKVIGMGVYAIPSQTVG